MMGAERCTLTSHRARLTTELMHSSRGPNQCLTTHLFCLFSGLSSPSSTACSQQNPLCCTGPALPPSMSPSSTAPSSLTSSHSGVLEGWCDGPGLESLISALCTLSVPCVYRGTRNERRLPAAVISDKPLQREVPAVLMFQDRHTQPGVTHQSGYL